MATSWSAQDPSRLTHVLQPTHILATHSMLAYRIASLATLSHRRKAGATYTPTSPYMKMSECAFPLFRHRTDPSKGGVDGHFSFEHTRNLLPQLSMLEIGAKSALLQSILSVGT